MKKRIISIALALCLGLGMLPIAVRAATNGHTQDEAVQWAKSMADSHWSISDGSTWTQCTEFVWQYYTYLGYDHPRGHAYQYLTDTYNPCPSGSGWTRPNINTARPGDIVIWDQNAYFREDKTDWAGSYGHIGIIVSVNGNTMVTVEANAGENYGSEHGVCGYKYNREVSCISGLIRPDFPSVSTTPTVAFSSWENSKYTYIRETDAAIGQQIDVSGGTCTKTGMILYDNNRKELGRAENPSYTDHRVFFKVNEELGVTLSPGTTYQYRFWAAVNGKIYYSDYSSFKTSGSANIAVTGVSLNKNSLSMKAGETASLTATISPSNATDKTVTWSSSNTKVATVSGGKVTAVAAGTATITAKAGNKTATCTVTVSNATVEVTGISLNKTSLSLTTGGNATLTATVSPSNATDKTVTWSSSNTKIATVSGGKVTAVAAGTATITAKAGNKTATCTVTVSNATVAVTGLRLNKISLTLTPGATETLTATVMPSNATDQTVTWSSNDTSVVTVDKNSVVTAIAAGSAKITAEAGGKTVTCTVTVAAVTVAVTSISLNKSALILNSGETATLTATISPSNATDKHIIWTSDNEAVATVYNGVVTAVSAGTTIIRAQAGGKSQSCTVTVTGGEYLFEISAYVDGVTEANYGYYGMADIYINGMLSAPNCGFYSAFLPAGTTYEIKNVTPQDGYKFDGAYSGSLKGTISNGPIYIVLQFSKTGSTSGNLYLDQVGVTMMVGGGTVILNPSNGTSFLAGHVVTWSSSDPSVATVSEGVVTPVSAGTAIITASYQGATATCTVTVRASKDSENQDVPSSWATAEVATAISTGLVPEVLQKNYTKPVSRADVAQMFINLLEQSSGKDIDRLMNEKGVSINKDAFTDTSDYAVLAANALGIINGTGNSQFSPDGTFTRSQIAAIINRVAKVLGVNTDGYTHSFTDVVGHWVDSELGWPSSVGIINGVGDNKFSPDSQLTTEQAIAITYRALKVLKSE